MIIYYCLLYTTLMSSPIMCKGNLNLYWILLSCKQWCLCCKYKTRKLVFGLTTILLCGTITKFVCTVTCISDVLQSLLIAEETLFETHIVLCKTFVSWNDVQSLVWLLSDKDALRNNCV